MNACVLLVTAHLWLLPLPLTGHLTDVLVCGGGSLIPNLPQRIIKEMRALAPFNVPEPALITMPEYLKVRGSSNKIS